MDSKPVFASMILWLLLSCILTGHPEGFNLKETTTSRRKRRSRNKRAQKVSLAALKKMAVFVANSWIESEGHFNTNGTSLKSKLEVNNTFSPS
ncbi:hypothetical protein ABFA07_011902 [Porites harrisoni]